MLEHSAADLSVESNASHEMLDDQGIHRTGKDGLPLSLDIRLDKLLSQVGQYRSNAFEIEKEVKEAHRIIDAHKVVDGKFILRKDSEGRTKSIAYRLQEMMDHTISLAYGEIGEAHAFLDLYGAEKGEKEPLIVRIERALNKSGELLHQALLRNTNE